MAISGYFMNGYWCIFYEWLLMIILLMVISGYYMNGYQWLFYEWLSVAIL
jgi:hypothetical protein